MSWFSLTILSVFFASFAAILQKVLMKSDNSNPYAYAIFFHFFLSVINTTLLIFHGFSFPLLNGNIVYVFLSSALWAGATIFLFKALQLRDVSEVTLLSTIRVVVTIVASMIFLQEIFTLQKALGTVIILFSIVLVTQIRKGKGYNKGIVYIGIMSVCSGFAIVVDSFNIKQIDVLTYNVLSNLLIGCMLFLFYPNVIKQWRHFTTPHFLKKMVPLGIFSSLQGTLYLFALTSGGNTAQVGVIRQSSVIVTVVLASIFLHEKKQLVRNIIAAVLVIVGVSLLG